MSGPSAPDPTTIREHIAAEGSERSDDTEMGFGRILRGAADHVEVMDEQLALDALLKALRSESREPVVLSRYILHRRLGSGGSGVVYVAQDPELDRQVAIKLLRTRRHAEPRDQLRLIREAQAMALLAHPNVVPIFDIGRFSRSDLTSLPANDDTDPLGDAELGVFIVMEYVPGQDLDAWLSERQRHWREVVRVFLQAGRGLQAAHQRGLLHRDFKPSNVLVAEDGRVRVFDFGLAQLEEDQSTIASAGNEASERELETKVLDMSLTASGLLVGTPAYMAPELYETGTATQRSDQYAFCVALYKAMYGEHPFPRSSTGPGTYSKHFGLDRMPPAVERSQAPKWLFRIIRRGLSPEPADRWSSMTELLTELGRDRQAARRRAAIVGLGTVLTFTSIAGLWNWYERRAIVCSGAAAHLEDVWNEDRRREIRSALLGSGVPYAQSSWDRVESTLDEYVRTWQQGHTAACEATNVLREQSSATMDLKMACLQRARNHLRATVDVLRVADKSVVQQASDLVHALPRLGSCAELEQLEEADNVPSEPEVASRVNATREQVARARALLNAGKFQEGYDSLQVLRDEMVAQALDHPPLKAEVALALGDALKELGNYETALVELKEALSLASEHGPTRVASDAAQSLTFVLGARLQQFEHAHWMADVGLVLARRLADPVTEGSVRSGLGTVFYHEGKYDAAEKQYQLAYELLRKVLPSDHPNIADLHNNLAIAMSAQAKYEESETHHRTVLALRQTTVGVHHPYVAISHNNLGAVLQAQAKFADAEEQFRFALAVFRRALGEDHTQVAVCHNNLGAALQSQGRYDEAQGHHFRALSIQKKAMGDEHPAVADTHSNLAIDFMLQKNYAEAEAHNRRALALRQKVLGPEHPNIALSHNNLGAVFNQQGKYKEAEEHHRTSLSIKIKALGERHPDTAHSYANLGNALQGRGKLEQAEQQYRLALSIREEMLNADHPEVAASNSDLGGVLLAQERPTEALPYLERAWSIYNRPNMPPEDVAAAAFALAKLLWGLGQQRDRALLLAAQARDGFARAGKNHEDALQAVASWLSEH